MRTAKPQLTTFEILGTHPNICNRLYIAGIDESGDKAVICRRYYKWLFASKTETRVWISENGLQSNYKKPENLRNIKVDLNGEFTGQLWGSYKTPIKTLPHFSFLIIPSVFLTYGKIFPTKYLPLSFLTLSLLTYTAYSFSSSYSKTGYYRLNNNPSFFRPNLIPAYEKEIIDNSQTISSIDIFAFERTLKEALGENIFLGGHLRKITQVSKDETVFFGEGTKGNYSSGDDELMVWRATLSVESLRNLGINIVMNRDE